MRIAFRCSVPGHLNPMTNLARKLKARGHDVVFIVVTFESRLAPASFFS